MNTDDPEKVTAVPVVVTPVTVPTLVCGLDTCPVLPGMASLKAVVAVAIKAVDPLFTVSISTNWPAVRARVPVMEHVLLPAAIVQPNPLETPFTNSVVWIESPVGTADPKVTLALVSVPVEAIEAVSHVLAEVLVQAPLSPM